MKLPGESGAQEEGIDRRESLALERTKMANERTFLAFLRSGFVILAGGVTFLKVFPGDPWLRVLGLFCLPLSGAMVLVGGLLYLSRRRRFSSPETR